MAKIYGLYHNENIFALEIKPFKEGEEFEGIENYNDCYYLSCDRKLLREKAISIKEKWITRQEEELEKLKAVKIKNKY